MLRKTERAIAYISAQMQSNVVLTKLPPFFLKKSRFRRIEL